MWGHVKVFYFATPNCLQALCCFCHIIKGYFNAKTVARNFLWQCAIYHMSSLLLCLQSEDVLFSNVTGTKLFARCDTHTHTHTHTHTRNENTGGRKGRVTSIRSVCRHHFIVSVTRDERVVCMSQNWNLLTGGTHVTSVWLRENVSFFFFSDWFLCQSTKTPTVNPLQAIIM